MRVVTRIALTTIGLWLVSMSTAVAQTSFPEVEPNSIKAQATIASGILPGDTLTGVSTGGATGAGLATLASADYFQTDPPVITPSLYCYTLDVTTSPQVDLSMRGETQTGGTINTGTDATFEANAPSMKVWYGFGSSEKVYVKVEGSSTTTASYALAYTCTPVTPASVGSFRPGGITVTTIGQGHTTNTELQLYDSTFNPVPGGHNDDYLASATTRSRVDVTLTPGVYYVAVSDHNMATNLSDAGPNEGNQNGDVLDFPGVIANGSTAGSLATPLDVSFSVSDGLTSVPVSAAKTGPFKIYWGTFTVLPGSPFCFGDGTGTSCPCGNIGAAGRGCASSAFAGGSLLAANGVASISADTLVLTALDITGPALFFQGSGQFAGGNGIPFGDGLLCAGGTIRRLGVVFPTGGTASYPGGLSPSPISVAGVVTSPASLNYQAWYRDSVLFCTVSTYNLTHALALTWTP